MSFTVNLYNTNKKRNSTAAVSGSGSSFSCDMIAPCSIYSPALRLHGITNPKSYNYCTISTYGYSYFIDDWEYNDTCWIARCSIDPLGTFRTDIKTGNAFALYSDSEGNTKIADNRITAEADITSSLLVTSPAFWDNNMGHYYIVRALGLNGGIVGYVMTAAQFQDFTNALSVWLDFDKTMQIQYADAISCVVGAMHFPMKPPSVTGTHVFLGSYDTEVTAGLLQTTQTGSATLSWTRQFPDWRSAVYEDYMLWLPFVGAIEIAGSDIGYGNSLRVDYTIDWVAGGILYKVYNGASGALLGNYSGVVGASVPVTGYMSDALAAVGGVINAGTSALGAMASVASGDMGGAAIGLGAAVGSLAGAAIGYKKKTASMIGGTTGNAFVGLDAAAISLYSIRHGSSETTPLLLRSILGLPCFKTVNMANVTGYLQTAGFSVGGNAPAYIKDQINSMLDSGVFIE